MMTALSIAFGISVGLILYSYAGYPILLGLAARLFGRTRPESCELNDHANLPFVSLVIAAYKEESVIVERIRNALDMDYPADRYEVLIGCDGAEDATAELAQSFQDSRIRVIAYPVRRGKPSVLNDTVPQAKGEIIAFSDANTYWEPDALKRIVRHFANDGVGGVCGQLLLTDPHTGENVDGVYWKYENVLKRWEGQLGALLGVNGAIYAIRRELWNPIPANSIVDDFLIGMRLHLAGRKLVFDESAIANEESAPSINAEFGRRARIGAGGFQSLCWLSPLLSPRYGMIAFAFWSHKVLRWFCPLFMALAFVSNLYLITEPFFQLTLVAQCAFYLTAFAGRHWTFKGRVGKLQRLTTMFTDMNLALTVGFWRWASKSQSGAWKRTERSQELRQTSCEFEQSQNSVREQVTL